MLQQLGIFIAFLFVSNTAIAQILNTKLDSVSYCLGLVMGSSIDQEDFAEINIDLLVEGLVDRLKKSNSPISVSNAEAMVRDYISAVELKKEEARTKKYLSYKLEGETFLKNNALRPEINFLEADLQYEPIEQGSGEYPDINSKIIVHYKGTLLDGTEFDNSFKRDEPLEFTLDQVIKAWRIAIPKMKRGSTWKIYAPYHLAYGEAGYGSIIPPYSMLIFEIELLDFKMPEP